MKIKLRLSLKNLFAWACVVLLLLQVQASGLWHISVAGNSPTEVDDRIRLLNADSLMYDVRIAPGAQRLSGHVHFLHKGMHLYCDSAVLYEQQQMFEAYGNVKMEQGDTLTLEGEFLRYDGINLIAEMRRNVVLVHSNPSSQDARILRTDSLNYDRVYQVGYYFEGGALEDGENFLTSDWGEYYTATRKATFNYDVRLENTDFTLTSDTLHYDTQTKWAHIVGPSRIVSGESSIDTEHGYYNSDTEYVRLYNRSVVHHRGKLMIADSIYYDKANDITTAYSNAIYEDSVAKNAFQGDYCKYEGALGKAEAYGRALVKDYSNGNDTLFVHADTLKMFTFHIDTDSMYRVLHGYFHVRAYRSDMQAVCDSLVGNSKEKKMTLYRDPIVWSAHRQVLGEEINVFSNDSTLDSVYVERQALMVEQVDSTHFNQVCGDVMRAYFDEKGDIKENHVDKNVYVVYYPLEKDSLLLYQNYTETSKLRMYMEERRMKRLWSPSAQGYFYPIGMAPKEQTFIPGFAWFDYIRPLSKHDLFEWRPKHADAKLKEKIRRQAPLQQIKK